MTANSSKWISEDEWLHTSRLLPIACIDVLPIVRDTTGRIARIGLILRTGPEDIGTVWTQIGGRMLVGENLHAGVGRHLQEVLCSPGSFSVAESPFTVMEYFTERREGAGFDPRKHAVAVCFLVDFKSSHSVRVVEGSEARDFKWFGIHELPRDLWPGTEIMIDRALTGDVWAKDDVIYSALASREASRDQMLWQTPALAMTGMAFLLTIALGDSGPNWARAMAAGLSVVVAIMSMQLMARLSMLAIQDADLLWDIERSSGMRPIHQYAPTAGSGRKIGVIATKAVAKYSGYLAQFRSRYVWMLGLGIFCVMSLLIASVLLLA
jgi:ADP-ribose pyrophosphatase YjhB (NUDIX family)